MAPRTSGLSSTIRTSGLLGMAFPDGSSLPNRLDSELDRHGVADQDAAGLQLLVPGQAELAAIELGAGGEAGHRETLRIAPATLDLGVQHDRASRPTDGQVAVQQQPPGVERLDAGADE